jgi:predicted kinase
MWTISKNKNWDYLMNTFSWIQDMQHVPQDVKYHAEGNVAIHTKMVLDELINLPAFHEIDEQDKEILFASALLHDVEKRSTSEIDETGNISSPGHAKKGEKTARNILFYDIATPFYIREQIAKLVRYHGLPLWFHDKQDIEKAIIHASLHVDTKLLVLLAKADVLGRICNDKNELLDRINYFEAYCVELNCYGISKEFPSFMSRLNYFKKEDASYLYEPFNNTGSVVYIMSALPGMGKDFYIQNNFKDIPVISLDEIRRLNKISPTDKSGNGRVIQKAKEQAKVYLRNKQSFIWNATNITKQMRTQLIDLMLSYNAYVKIVYVETDFKNWIKQNKNRAYPLPENVLLNLFSKLEVPEINEAHEVVYATSNIQL